MMLILRAASILCVALRSHAARGDRSDGLADAVERWHGAPTASPTLEAVEDEEDPQELRKDPKQDVRQDLSEAAVRPAATGAPGSGKGVEAPASEGGVHAKHFERTVAHTEQIKAAVDRVHAKTQVAREAAVAVKDSFGKYQGTINDLKTQLDSVDDVAHKFEDELWEHLAGEEATRLKPFEEYSQRFGGVEGVEEAEEPTAGASPQSSAGGGAAAERSFLEGGHLARHSSGNETGGNRFEKSVQQSEQIKVAVGKVKEKVEAARQAAAKVKQGFEDYKGKVVEVRNQLNEVDKQQHEYQGKLLNHYDGQEGDRMSAFDSPPSLEGSSNATAKESGLLQGRERRFVSKEHVSVSRGGAFHAARR